MNEELNNKLKVYSDLISDIKLLESKKNELRKDLEELLKRSGATTLKTELGTVTYVTVEREVLDSEQLKAMMTDEMYELLYSIKESKYIKITPAKKKENLE